MSRRKLIKKIEIAPDIRYNSVLLSRFINKMMKKGKKSLAEKIVYGAFSKAEQKLGKDAFEIFSKAIENTRPYIEIKPIRIGGANYQVPVPVNQERGDTLASQWIISSSKKRSEKAMVDRLAAELIDANNNQGLSIKERDTTHKMAEANRAFAHFININKKKTSSAN